MLRKPLDDLLRGRIISWWGGGGATCYGSESFACDLPPPSDQIPPSSPILVPQHFVLMTRFTLNTHLDSTRQAFFTIFHALVLEHLNSPVPLPPSDPLLLRNLTGLACVTQLVIIKNPRYSGMSF